MITSLTLLQQENDTIHTAFKISSKYNWWMNFLYNFIMELIKKNTKTKNTAASFL